MTQRIKQTVKLICGGCRTKRGEPRYIGMGHGVCLDCKRSCLGYMVDVRDLVEEKSV